MGKSKHYGKVIHHPSIATSNSKALHLSIYSKIYTINIERRYVPTTSGFRQGGPESPPNERSYAKWFKEVFDVKTMPMAKTTNSSTKTRTSIEYVVPNTYLSLLRFNSATLPLIWSECQTGPVIYIAPVIRQKDRKNERLVYCMILILSIRELESRSFGRCLSHIP